MLGMCELHEYDAQLLDSAVNGPAGSDATMRLPDFFRQGAPGEVIVLQPYVWAGRNDQSFTFNYVNYAVAAATLQDCTLLLLRVAGTSTCRNQQ